MRRYWIPAALILAAAAAGIAPATADDVELVVEPGSSDGFFDGSDHQTSGIDVYIEAPAYGAIPMPGEPEAVPYEPVPGEYERYMERMGNKSVGAVPGARRTSMVSGGPAGRVLAIVYDDSRVQYVDLGRDFRDVARLTVLPARPAGATAASGGEASAPATAHQAQRRLEAGNGRFVSGRTAGPRRSSFRRRAVALGQRPVAVIVGCADSRVPPEILFDEGLGDLFVVRTAGHVLDDAAIGSVEYAVEHLGVPLIVVLGHEKCGAVAATLEGGEVHGHLGTIVGAIRPAVEETAGGSGDRLDASVRAHVRRTVRRLEEAAPILARRNAEGNVRILGARYDLDDGRVEWLP